MTYLDITKDLSHFFVNGVCAYCERDVDELSDDESVHCDARATFEARR